MVHGKVGVSTEDVVTLCDSTSDLKEAVLFICPRFLAHVLLMPEVTQILLGTLIT